MKKKFNILLFQAPCKRLKFNISDIYPLPRLGLANISAFLKSNSNYDVIIFEFSSKNWLDEASDIISSYNPNVVGISTTIMSLKEGFLLTSLVKKISNKITTIIGGYGTGFSAKLLYEYSKNTDFYIRGEGEISFLKFINEIYNNSFNFEKVPGLIWRNNDEIIENNIPDFRDLNDGILPDYDSLPMKSYHLHPPMGVYSPSTIVETARGCSYDCTFCCLCRQLKFKSPENVLKEINFLISNYNIKEIHFIDPTFTIDEKRIFKICELIAPLKIKWSCKTRVDKVSKKILKAMKESGCFLISFGVESASSHILDKTNKAISISQTKLAFKYCHELSIRTAAYLIIGNPGESDETVSETIQFVKKLSPNYVLYGVLMPDPYNSLTTKSLKKDSISEKTIFEYYVTDKENILNNITITDIPMKKVKKWISKCVRSFYFSPLYIIKTLKNIKTFGDVKNILKGFYFIIIELL